MYGGCDQGFCFSYWSLSYRRKLIRSIWSTIIAIPIWIVVLTFQSDMSGWLICAIVVVATLGGVLQALYNYRCWQTEIHADDFERPAQGDLPQRENW